MPQLLSDAEKRHARTQRLIAELAEKAEIDTDGARERCLRIAREVVELFKAEIACQHAEFTRMGARGLRARASEAQRAVAATRETSELIGMYVGSGWRRKPKK
jgi:hypothetical protein